MSLHDATLHPIPPRPSNRHLLEQFLLWGAVETKNNGQWITLKLPGGDTIKVRPPQFSQGTPRPATIEGIKSLGVGEGEFWARKEPATVPDTPPPPKEPALVVQRRNEGVDPRLLEADELERRVAELRQEAHDEAMRMLAQCVEDAFVFARSVQIHKAEIRGAIENLAAAIGVEIPDA
jgi:hypothetical protein